MEDPVFRLVAGLGNPGRQYENTRHNVGFLVADELARRAGVAFAPVARWNAEIARAGEVTFMKPMTFMNLSGEAVGGFCRFHKLEPSSVLVIIDDVALEPGRLRLRRSGSDGGHNGLASVIAHLGTDRVPRLRVGIGGGRHSLVDHVLGRFSDEEKKTFDAAVARAADAFEFAQQNGLEKAMNQYN